MKRGRRGGAFSNRRVREGVQRSSAKKTNKLETRKWERAGGLVDVGEKCV
jgi:hypothetical protein